MDARRARLILKEASKSFYFASSLLRAPQKAAISVLYAWCRHTDDLTDLAKPELPEDDWIEASFQELKARYKIPEHYPEELKLGMQSDRLGVDINSEGDLNLYAYRVAGTVGLMCCHIFGIKDLLALKEARDLGMAMQYTNILRDLGEDWAMGRIYLPKSWTQRLAIDRSNLLAPAQSRALEECQKQLFLEAESLYISGLKGTQALPRRVAWAVRTAAYIYREIGVRVITAGKDALSTRMVVPWHQKCFLGIKALWHTLREGYISDQRPLLNDFKEVIRF